MPNIPQSGYYNIFVQIPAIANAASQLSFQIYANGQAVDTMRFYQPLPAKDWIYVGTANWIAHAQNYLELKVIGREQAGKVVAADVTKFSALVRERQLAMDHDFIHLGEVSQDDTLRWQLKIQNRGYKHLTLFGSHSTGQFVSSAIAFPIEMAGMSTISLPMQFYSSRAGAVADTFIIHSDDPVQPQCRLPVSARVEPFFMVVDNEDSSNYREFGTWSRSNAQAYGPTSRYAWLTQIPRPWAAFTAQLPRSGVYELFEIVPKTVNASNYAVYVLSIADVVVDSVVVDQNAGSGSLVSLGRFYLPARHKIEVRVVDTGKNSNPNAVLRADAIKFALIAEIAGVADPSSGQRPTEFGLVQNYPNPFNARTTIRYTIPRETKVELRVLNLLGQEIAKLVDEHQPPGYYSVDWEADNIPSGIYLYQLRTERFCRAKKFMVIK